MTTRLRGTSYYDLLGVARDTTLAEIRVAYRRLMRAEHPDRSGTRDHAFASRLNAAFEVLSGTDARASYDACLAQESAPATRLPEPARYGAPSDVLGFDEGCWDLPDWPR
ncbi:MAG: J domain-containing protein [Dermatophilaceae bacterium]